MQAQHYRIPTRMLDWTQKPEIALYFAIEDDKLDHVDGQFLVIYTPLFDIRTEGGQQQNFFTTHPRDLAET